MAHKSVSRGCPQGSACGPGFWNILYDGVLKLDLPVDCELVAFADDLILLSWGRDLELLQAKVNSAIALVARWGRLVKLEFNEAKTKVMTFTKSRTVPAINVTMNGVSLEMVDEIKYLGVVINRKLKWQSHFRHLQMKANKLMSKMAAVAQNT